MNLTRRALVTTAATAATATALPLVPARAQKQVIRIGLLNDQSGNYRDDGGPTGTACARQALIEFAAASGKGLDVELLVADHENKPDIGVGIDRQWFDRDGVDMILDVPTSSVALAVN